MKSGQSEWILQLLVEDEMLAAIERGRAASPARFVEPYNPIEEFSAPAGSSASRRFTIPAAGLLESVAIRVVSADADDTIELRGRGFRLNIQPVPVASGTNTFDYSQNPVSVQPNNIVEAIFSNSGGAAKTVAVILYLRR